MSSNAKNDWLKGPYAKATGRFPERKDGFTTTSKIELAPVYVSADAETDYENDIAFPGEYPFTRGVQPTMYRGRLWTMRQYAGFGSAKETNERYHYLLKAGQTGLSVAFDLPTQIGYDPDHPLAASEVGKVGVSIASLADVETLFNGIPLDKVSVSMTINATAAYLLSGLIVAAEKSGIDPKVLRGTVQNDILKEYSTRGTYRFPVEPSMRLTTDLITYCRDNVPKWNTISISGYHIREAGCTAVQEVAFTLANGRAYVKAAMDAGMEVDDFAPRLSFFFNAHNNFFEEVSKFRAARRLWARIMKEEFNAQNPKSMMLRFHTQTAGCTLTASQYHNNVVRVAFQALSAVLGGTQSLHTNSRDEAFTLPTEDSAKLALRTQQIIAEESGSANVIDPLGGAPYIEWLTNRIEAGARDYLAKIDEIGGAVKAVESGFVQKEIQSAAYEYQQGVESADIVVVGDNKYVEEEDTSAPLLRVDDALVEERRNDLDAIRKKRNSNNVKNTLARLKETAAGEKENTFPFLIDCVREYATIGEVCHTLADVFGEYEGRYL